MWTRRIELNPNVMSWTGIAVQYLHACEGVAGCPVLGGRRRIGAGRRRRAPRPGRPEADSRGRAAMIGPSGPSGESLASMRARWKKDPHLDAQGGDIRLGGKRRPVSDGRRIGMRPDLSRSRTLQVREAWPPSRRPARTGGRRNRPGG